MTKREFLSLFEEILEAPTGTLNGNELLPGMQGWDSLAVVSLIAVVDERLGITLSPKDIAKAASVADLVGLLGDKMSG